MAASVRIEDEAFSDGRIEHLGVLIGASKFEALGRLSYLWRQCTQEQTHVLPESFVRVFVDPEKLIESRLAERTDAGIRISGTRGRIEWLAKLRKNGRKGGRPRKPNGNHLVSGSQTKSEPPSNPPAPAPTSSPAPTSTEDPEKNSARPSGGGDRDLLGELKAKVDAATGDIGRARQRKAKPSEPTEDERAAALRVLEKLSARNGVAYSGSAEHIGLIARHLRNGVDEMDLRYVVGYCAAELGWSDKPDMVAYLRPETLFGPKTLSKYLDAARTWAAKLPDNQPQAGTA